MGMNIPFAFDGNVEFSSTDQVIYKMEAASLKHYYFSIMIIKLVTVLA